ncbi:MAG: hypothetical protein AB1401_12385 [Thermodesulfobacteriota bacterium]
MMKICSWQVQELLPGQPIRLWRTTMGGNLIISRTGVSPVRNVFSDEKDE